MDNRKFSARKGSTAIICLSPYSGGMEIDAIKLAKKLSPYTTVTLIAKKGYFIANSSNEYIGYNNIELETISFHASLSFSIIFGIRRIIQEKGVENVIFFGASELKSLYFSFLGLDINLIIRHGTTKSHPKKDWFHRLIYSNVNYHVSICQHLQKNVEYIIPFGGKSKSILLYSSIEIPSVQSVPHEKLTLLHIGRIAPGKGQADAIKACKILYENGIDFIFYLVGGFDQKYEQPFMELYDSLPYKDKIVLSGFSDKVGDYYSQSDIFLFPSHGEGLSNAFLEALSYGLECIAYHNTSFPELQEMGFNFHLVEDKNIHQLSTTLLFCAQHPAFYSENRAKIANDFSVQKEIEYYLELLI
jgi:glycosyltransferase involved in cell wall biosynthesis